MVEDLVVVVPGITGSTLHDADGREVWGLSAGSLARALVTFGRSITRLTLPPGHGDEPAPDGVTAGELMRGFHAIPGVWTPLHGYDTLIDFLRAPRFGLLDAPAKTDGDAPAGNLVQFAYDWRLSNRYNAELLRVQVEHHLARWRASDPTRSDARVAFICHSMGGLITRWYLDRLGGAGHTKCLITLGTPHRGAMNAVEQLANGVRKGKGPFTLNLTHFARSLPSGYQLLPEYACIDVGEGQLAKTTELSIPNTDPDMVLDGMRFHDELDASHERGEVTVIPIVGIRQPTWTTGRLTSDGVVPEFTIDEADEQGDGTVPRLSARPKNMSETDGGPRGLADGHGHLQANSSVWDQIEFALTAKEIFHRNSAGTIPSVWVPDLFLVGEEIPVTATAGDQLLEAVLFDERSTVTDRITLTGGRGGFGPQPAGAYSVLVQSAGGGTSVDPVRHTTLVFEDDHA